MHEPAFLLFASDATLVALAAGVFLLVALIAGLGEARRKRRRHIDAVGFMPWATISILAFFTGLVLLAVALSGWTQP